MRGRKGKTVVKSGPNPPTARVEFTALKQTLRTDVSSEKAKANWRKREVDRSFVYLKVKIDGTDTKRKVRKGSL